MKLAEIGWLWLNRIPLDMLTLLTGDVQAGKSLIAADLVARMVTGREWPDGGLPPADSVAVYLSVEDDLPTTIGPRLKHHGLTGDARDRVLGIGRGDPAHRQLETALSEHPARLERLISEHQERNLVLVNGEQCLPTVLLVIDPAEAFMIGVNTNRSNEVRHALNSVDDMCGRLGVTILAIRHPNKNSGETKALYRTGGSMAWIEHPRSVLIANIDPTDDDDLPEMMRRRAMAQLKHNLGPPQPPLTYTIGPPSPGKLSWTGTSEVTPNQLMASPDRAVAKQNSKSYDAETWLQATMIALGGSASAGDIQRLAERAAIKRMTLYRARDKIGVELEDERDDAGRITGHTWRLP